MAGIYIHIPFCRRKCRYCDFHSIAQLDRKRQVLDAMAAELLLRRHFLSGETIHTVYFGGGTPSICSVPELRHFMDLIRTYYTTSAAFREVTLEANPEDLTPEYLETLSDTGVNRLSIGVQSFYDRHLAFFDRRHTGSQAFEAVRSAKRSGFDNIGIDLIYGVPGMTRAEFADNLERFLSLEIPHLSAYHLTIEPGTVFGRQMKQGKLFPVPESVSSEHYRLLEDTLLSAGYVHYEISNFALPGYESVHNSNYWRSVPYLGIGPSAHSYKENTRSWNTARTGEYVKGVATGDVRESEELTPQDRINEYLMTSLRTARGASWIEVEHLAGTTAVTRLKIESAKFIGQGVLRDTDGFLRIPSEHFLLSDYIVASLFF